MSDENNAYNGYRFLLDAKNSRQYAVNYVQGRPVAPIRVFAQDTRDNGFNPRETIFALDDEKTVALENRRIVLTTNLFQISTNENAEPKNLRTLEVKYETMFGQNPDGNFTVQLSMTPETRDKLEMEGFEADYPVSFKESIAANDPIIQSLQTGNVGAIINFIENLSFPPHHLGDAAIARLGVDQNAETTQAAPRRKDVLGPQLKDKKTAPANEDFNKTATPARRDYKVSDSQITALIKTYCEDLTELAQQGKLDPVVGRDQEVDQALKVLSRRKQSSLCFTGDAGVGKTAMFSALAQRMADEQQPVRIIQLDLQAMNAGAKFRGQFEEKLKPLIDGLKEREGVLKGQKVIIAIDEIHSQLTSGKAEGGTDAGNMMKPFFTSKGISVMGTTTGEEYRKHIEKDPALASRFEQLVLNEPSPAATKEILQRLWPLVKEHHELTKDLTEEDFDYIVQMTTRYAPNESNPRKGEKVLDMAGASARFRGADFIEKEDIISAVAQMSKLSVDFLSQKDGERFLKMETELPKEVLGQPHAIEKVVDGLIGARSGLNDPNQPWGCFVFQGPTGTGKTELCKALGRYLLGTEDALIQLNMGEFAQEHTVSRLIGAPPGYVGFDTAEPALTERIRQRPYSILLLDEIEKAHPKVFDVLLPILNDGKMDDNQGKSVQFNNVIVVMTTNMGAKEAMARLEGRGGIGFGGVEGDSDPQKLEEDLSRIYAKARDASQGGFFRPELVNRIEELGGFVTFVPLSPEAIRKIVDREVDKVAQRLSGPGAGLKDVKLELTPEIKDQLAVEGYNRTMGARPLRKVIREKLANPLGKWLMGHKEEVAQFIKDNGATSLVIEKIGKSDFSVKMAATAPAIAAPVNDNKNVPVKANKPASPKL